MLVAAGEGRAGREVGGAERGSGQPEQAAPDLQLRRAPARRRRSRRVVRALLPTISNSSTLLQRLCSLLLSLCLLPKVPDGRCALRPRLCNVRPRSAFPARLPTNFPLTLGCGCAGALRVRRRALGSARASCSPTARSCTTKAADPLPPARPRQRRVRTAGGCGGRAGARSGRCPPAGCGRRQRSAAAEPWWGNAYPRPPRSSPRRGWGAWLSTAPRPRRARRPRPTGPRPTAAATRPDPWCGNSNPPTEKLGCRLKAACFAAQEATVVASSARQARRRRVSEPTTDSGGGMATRANPNTLCRPEQAIVQRPTAQSAEPQVRTIPLHSPGSADTRGSSSRDTSRIRVQTF